LKTGIKSINKNIQSNVKIYVFYLCFEALLFSKNVSGISFRKQFFIIKILKITKTEIIFAKTLFELFLIIGKITLIINYCGSQNNSFLSPSFYKFLRKRLKKLE